MERRGRDSSSSSSSPPLPPSFLLGRQWGHSRWSRLLLLLLLSSCLAFVREGSGGRRGRDHHFLLLRGSSSSSSGGRRGMLFLALIAVVGFGVLEEDVPAGATACVLVGWGERGGGVRKPGIRSRGRGIDSLKAQGLRGKPKPGKEGTRYRVQKRRAPSLLHRPAQPPLTISTHSFISTACARTYQWCSLRP